MKGSPLRRAQIIGQGGHAQDIAAWTKWPTVRHHVQASGAAPFTVGINDPWLRSDVAERLTEREFTATEAVVHASVVMDADTCWLSAGVVVGPLSSLGCHVVLGRHTHVGAGCHLTRCVLGHFVTVAPGVTICGDVVIGDRVMIGAGATIRNMVTIGSDVTIGAGAAVVHDVPDGATVKGVPAK